MGAAAARSGAPCVPTATPGPWDIPPAIGDAWFIHYPIYTGCVAARLETRSAAQRADHKPEKKTAVATPAPGDSPAKGTRSQVRTTGSTGGSRACGPSSRPRSKSAPASRPGRARSRLDEINEEDEDEEEDEEDHSNLDEDSGEEQDSETGQGSDDHDQVTRGVDVTRVVRISRCLLSALFRRPTLSPAHHLRAQISHLHCPRHRRRRTDIQGSNGGSAQRPPAAIVRLLLPYVAHPPASALVWGRGRTLMCGLLGSLC